jgi:hypothetical protein
MKTCRVVTRNHNGSYSIVHEGTRPECKRFIIGRWGHWPPFAAITTRESNFDSLF